MAPEAAAEMKTSAAMPMVIDVLLLMRGLLDAMVDCSLLITSSYRRLDAASSRAEEEVVGGWRGQYAGCHCLYSFHDVHLHCSICTVDVPDYMY